MVHVDLITYAISMASPCVGVGPRPFGVWPDYVVPVGWDEFTVEDEQAWYGDEFLCAVSGEVLVEAGSGLGLGRVGSSA